MRFKFKEFVITIEPDTCQECLVKPMCQQNSKTRTLCKPLEDNLIEYLTYEDWNFLISNVFGIEDKVDRKVLEASYELQIDQEDEIWGRIE